MQTWSFKFYFESLIFLFLCAPFLFQIGFNFFDSNFQHTISKMKLWKYNSENENLKTRQWKYPNVWKSNFENWTLNLLSCKLDFEIKTSNVKFWGLIFKNITFENHTLKSNINKYRTFCPFEFELCVSYYYGIFNITWYVIK